MQAESNTSAHGLMAAMPDADVAALREAHPELEFTEWEARMWGLMMFTATGAYSGAVRSLKASGSGETWRESITDWVLQDRASNLRHGLIRGPWPEAKLTVRGAPAVAIA